MGNSQSREKKMHGERNLLAWIRLACLAAWAALAVPFFLGKVYVADDLGEYHLPLCAFYSEQLSRGESFDWLPTLYNGFYLTGEGQLGTYHPLHLLLYRWLPLGAAFDLEVLLSYPFMLVGMAMFLKRCLKNRAAAWFGALVFTFSGFNLLHFVHPNAVAVVAHIPWLLWAIDVALRSPSARETARAQLAVGFLTSSQLLLGYPQYVWFSLLVEVGYAGWRWAANETARRPWLLLAAKFCGILAGAIQWLPTLDALAGSMRRWVDPAFANSGSLAPLNVVQLIAPYLFSNRVVGQNTHELGLYTGASACLLCCWLSFNRQRLGKLRPVAAAAMLLGIVSLLLAFGQYGFLYQFERYLPLVNRFRFPCRAIVLFHFAVAVGAALGFLILLRPGERAADDGWGGLLPVWLVAAASTLMAIAGPWLWRSHVATVGWLWLGPAFFVAAALLITWAARGHRAALFAMVVLATVDQGFYGASYAVYSPQRTADLRQFVAATPLPPAGDGGPSKGERIALDRPCDKEGIRAGNRVLLTGVARVDGYSGLVPEKRLDYRQTDVLRLSGARWMRNCPAERDREQANDGGWARIQRPLDRVRLVTKVVTCGSANSAIVLASLRSGGVAVVDEPVELPAGTPGTVTLSVDRPGSVELFTASETRQLLVLADSFHAGWQVAVDGVPRPVFRVDGDFLGCLVDGGRHQVAWQFRPASLRYGALLSVCGVGLMLCLFVICCPAAKREAATALGEAFPGRRT